MRTMTEAVSASRVDHLGTGPRLRRRASRVGVASGPAVAGVIGVRKFAYDLWGDTVNLASRLEEYGIPGHVLVSEATANQVTDQFDFAPTQMMDVKGKGPTPVRVLLGPRSDVPADVPVASPASTGHES